MKRLAWAGILVLLVGLMAGCVSSTSLADLPTLREQAQQAYESGDYARAVAALKTVVAAAPDDAESRFRLGRAHAALKEWDSAAAEFQAVIQLNPDDADAHSNLGGIYYEQQRLDEAVKEFRQATLLKPDDAVFHYNLGAAYAGLNRLNEAEAEFLSAKQFNPDLPETYLGLGAIYAAQGKNELAREAFERVLALSKDAAVRAEAEQQLQYLR